MPNIRLVEVFVNINNEATVCYLVSLIKNIKN